MILVTGSAGFIGSCLVNELVKNYKVVGIDDLSSGSKQNIVKHKNYVFIKGNCGDLNLLNSIKKIKVIIHLAGQTSGEKSFEDPLNDFNRNTQNTLNLLDYAIKIKCKHFIFTSSMSVYGNKYKIKLNEKLSPSPISFYALSKATSEKYIKKYRNKGLNYTILRFFVVYGSEQKLGNLKQGMIRIYLTQIFKNKSLIIKGSGKRYRDFIHIRDVLNYIKIIINNKKYFNQIFNIGTGKKTTVNSLINLIQKKIDFNFKIKFIGGTKDDQFGGFADVNKITKLSKIKPKISLDEGLNEIIKNIKTK